METRQPDFSVIIPTYFEESAIENTLTSINRASSGHSTETIVVDGGSTDRTLDIASQFTENIHVLNQRGIGLARNHGARHASGEVLVFLDSDTRVPENFFDELSRVFNNPEVLGANCNVMPCPRVRPTPKERFFYRAWGKLRNEAYRIRPCGTGDNGIIVRKEAFQKTGGFDERMQTMEDLDFVLRASKHGRFLFLDNVMLTESMRRIRKVGLLKFSTVYIYNFFYYLVKRKPKIDNWDPVR